MPISRIAIYGVGLGLGTEAWGERKAAVPLPAECVPTRALLHCPSPFQYG